MNSDDIQKNEAFIQYKLMRELETMGYGVYPEQIFKLKGRTKRNYHQRSIRVDIVVSVDNDLLCVIEVKKKQLKDKSTIDKLKSGRQFNKYKELGLPFFYCINIDGIESTIRKVRQSFMEYLKK